MGVITFLRNVLGIHRGDPHETTGVPRQERDPRVEIYGPRGIRHFIRTIFTLTHTRSADQYCAHELLFPGEEPSAPGDVIEQLHPSEEAGRDIRCDENGYWREIVDHHMNNGRHRTVVDAGPIVHRGGCTNGLLCGAPRLTSCRPMHRICNTGAIRPVP